MVLVVVVTIMVLVINALGFSKFEEITKYNITNTRYFIEFPAGYAIICSVLL